MSRSLLAVLTLLSSCGVLGADDTTDRAQTLAQEILSLDGHVDVPYRLWEQSRSGAMDDVSRSTGRGDFDWPRAVAGGLDAPFFSIYTPSECESKGDCKETADALIDIVDGIVENASDKFTLARTAAEVRAAAAAGKIAILLGMENGSPLEKIGRASCRERV